MLQYLPFEMKEVPESFITYEKSQHGPNRISETKIELFSSMVS